MAKRLSWAVRIERAKLRGKFTTFEQGLAENSWRTCAIGEKHGWPASVWPLRNSKEGRLGLDFGDAVARGDIPTAERIYAEIQALPVGATA